MQSRDEVQGQQNKTGATKRIYEAGHRVGKLVGQLDIMLIEEATSDGGGAIEMGDIICREERCKEIADQAT